MKNWMQHSWFARVVDHCTRRRPAAKRFVLDDMVPFSFVVDFDHRWPERQRGASSGR